MSNRFMAVQYTTVDLTSYRDGAIQGLLGAQVIALHLDKK